MKKSLFLALAKNTFKKNLRSKTLIFLIIISLLLALSLNAFLDFFNTLVPPDSLAPGAPVDLGSLKFQIFYNVILWFGAFVATFLGVDCLKSDSKEGLTQQILVFPLHPISYITHRIISTLIIVIICYFVCFLIGTLIFSSSLSSSLLKPTLLLSFLFNVLSLFSIITLATFFSTFLSIIQSFICTTILSILISWANYAFPSGVHFDKLDMLSIIKIIFSSLFPRLGHLNTLSSQIYLEGSLTLSIPSTIVHALALDALFIYLVYLICRRKDYTI